QLCSNPDYAEQISTILNPIREKALTKSALETIAIIAYKQPITKLEIEEIRKIHSADYAIQVLLDNNMIEIVGRKDAVGKPYLFGTTDTFLKRFNLKDITDLPDYEELLERIEVIRNETYDNQLASDGLYRDYEVPNEEEIPDFLKNEKDIKQIKAEEQEMLDHIDQILKQNNIQKMDFSPKEEQVKI
ncbi:MAG: SMC-Scp complex subunit ScpB, partial [Clostridia bacterium]|nr:SMC-Scp complex subunit ScpB [Clostridia bacterium]